MSDARQSNKVKEYVYKFKLKINHCLFYVVSCL